MKTVSEIEAEKYTTIWSLPQYHENSPGAQMIDMFLRIARPAAGASIIDVGCGAGAASELLHQKGFRVAGFDLTDTAWKNHPLPILTGSVWHGIPIGVISDNVFDYGYCCDMMEHIPTQFVALTIYQILQACHHAFFSVSFQEDNFGNYIREPLHHTVKPFTWWRDTFREVGTVLEARDIMGDGVFYVAG